MERSGRGNQFARFAGFAAENSSFDEPFEASGNKKEAALLRRPL
jgi:hypothetical protein